MTLSSSQEVAIAIGLWPCGSASTNVCADMNVTQILGNVVYAGPYEPKLQQGQEGTKPPYQIRRDLPRP